MLLFMYLLHLLKTATVFGVVLFRGLIGSSCRVNWFQLAPKEEMWNGVSSEGDTSQERETPPLPFLRGTILLCALREEIFFALPFHLILNSASYKMPPSEWQGVYAVMNARIHY